MQRHPVSQQRTNHRSLALTLACCLALALVTLACDDDGAPGADGDADQESAEAETVDCTACDQVAGIYCFDTVVTDDCPSSGLFETFFTAYQTARFNLHLDEDIPCRLVVAFDKLPDGLTPDDVAEGNLLAYAAGCDFSMIEFYNPPDSIDPPPAMPAWLEGSQALYIGTDTCHIKYSKAACASRK